MFYGRIHVENYDLTYDHFVFSDTTLLKNETEKATGHSVLYKSDEVDFDFIRKKLKRFNHNENKSMLNDMFEAEMRKIKEENESNENKNVERHENETFEFHFKRSTGSSGGAGSSSGGGTSSAGSPSPTTSTTTPKPKSKTPFKNICYVHVDFHSSYLKTKFSTRSAILEVLSMFHAMNKLFNVTFPNGDKGAWIQYKIANYTATDEVKEKALDNGFDKAERVLTQYNVRKEFKTDYCANLLLVHQNWGSTLGMAQIGSAAGNPFLI